MRQDIYDVMRKWLWLEDEQGIDIILAAVIANMYPGEPVWMFIVDAPSGGKTEICRALSTSTQYIYAVDSLTPQSLLSGFKPSKHRPDISVDILNDLDGKVLVIKDFTTILQKPQQSRDELFGRLRAAYDGTLCIAFGSGVKRVERVAKFGLLAAVTAAIDDFGTIHALLGERFLKIRPRNNDYQMGKAALKHSGQELVMRREISQAVDGSLRVYAAKVSELPTLLPTTEEKFVALAMITARLRTPIPRDHYHHQVISIPQPEYSPRLAKQYKRLTQALVLLGAYNYAHITRICEDSTIRFRLPLLKKVKKAGTIRSAELAEGYKFPRNYLNNMMEDLWLLGTVNRALVAVNDDAEPIDGKKKTYEYSITKQFGKLMENAQI